MIVKLNWTLQSLRSTASYLGYESSNHLISKTQQSNYMF